MILFLLVIVIIANLYFAFRYAQPVTPESIGLAVPPGSDITEYDGMSITEQIREFLRAISEYIEAHL